MAHIGEHPAIDDSDSDDEPVQDHPLLSYACRGWKHLGHVSDEDPCIMDALSRLNLEFRRNTKKHHVLATAKYWRSWNEPRWLYASDTLPSLLFIPLEHGKPWMVEFFVNQRPDLLDVDIGPGLGSPLMFAIAKNSDCLSILLKLGVDYNKLSSFSPGLYDQYISGGSHAPISWAAVTGSEVTVDFLLSQTEVDIPNDILHIAVGLRMPLHECIRKFRQHGADINFTVKGSTPIHDFLARMKRSYDKTRRFYNISTLLHIIKALVEPSCNLSLQNPTARTVLHIALDAHLEDVIVYLLEQNAGLSATATLHPEMWSWATNETWFPKVQAAVLAANQPRTRIKGKVVDYTTTSRLIEFSVLATEEYNNPNPICAVVVSTILNSKLSSE